MTPRTIESGESDLSGYEVLVCVCGGIAAYKACEVVSSLVQRGAGVTVAMTRSARRFVGKVTFGALSGRLVLTSLWKAPQPDDVQHIGVTARADLILVVPATANMIGKLAGGRADDLVSTLLISADSPIEMVPAMNDRMWGNPFVQRNVTLLKEQGIGIVDPVEGWLACRSVGRGRMAEPDTIVERSAALLKSQPPKTCRG